MDRTALHDHDDQDTTMIPTLNLEFCFSCMPEWRGGLGMTTSSFVTSRSKALRVKIQIVLLGCVLGL
jgi:hypothetical protein